MKLYYATGSCSLAPRIILHETGLPCESVKVNLTSHTLEDGTDYYRITSRGMVPLLELDDGEHLKEGPIICQYLADKAGATHLLPPCGDPRRYQVAAWQNFITSELHKGFSPLFNSQFHEEARALFHVALLNRYEVLNRHLAHSAYLYGDDFTVADAYLFTVTRWADVVGLDLKGFENVQRLMTAIQQRPAVQAAMRAEGLI